MPMSRQDLVDDLPEELVQYIPDTLPENTDPDSEAEADGVYLGIALTEWAIHEKGLEPEEASMVVRRALTHGVAAGRLNQLGLPDKLFRN
jgi:hypothetical protein